MIDICQSDQISDLMIKYSSSDPTVGNIWQFDPILDELSDCMTDTYILSKNWIRLSDIIDPTVA